jgi:hypothetical protein
VFVSWQTSSLVILTGGEADARDCTAAGASMQWMENQTLHAASVFF